MELPNKFDNRKLSMRMIENFERSFDLDAFMKEIDSKRKNLVFKNV